MSDRTFNEWSATAHLVDCAEDWMRLFEDQSAPWGVRLEALAFACCIYQELCMEPRR